MKTPAFVWAFVLFFTACQNNPQNKPSQAEPDKFSAVSDVPATYLEGIYATSMAPESSLQQLFDGNTATIWHTRLGAGPDEGIMLYFQQAQSIASVEIMAEKDCFSDADQAPMLEIFENGAVTGNGAPDSKIQCSDKPIKSLFIRFLRTGKEVETKVDGRRIDTYPNNANIGIREIVLRKATGGAIRIVPPKPVRGTAVASSTLKPVSAYGTANLFDGRKEFCWVEGNPATAGEGETITFSFDDPNTHITALQILDGYQRSEEHFNANARVRDFELTGADGTSTVYTLQDTRDAQRIELSPALRGGTFTLKIKSIYSGKTYKDLAISDILFFDGETPFVLQTSSPAELRKDLLVKTQHSPLEKLLDRRIINQENEEDVMVVYQSIILRSDGTFVLYIKENDPNDTSSTAYMATTVADGNWELLQADANQASVKIFGKWTDSSNLAAYYKGASKQEFTRIFNEVLHVEKGMLQGSKMLGTFFFL